MQIYALVLILVAWIHCSVHFNGHFPGEPGLAGFIKAKDIVEPLILAFRSTELFWRP